MVELVDLGGMGLSAFGILYVLTALEVASRAVHEVPRKVLVPCHQDAISLIWAPSYVLSMLACLQVLVFAKTKSMLEIRSLPNALSFPA
jgi:hypothetical protein